MEYSIVGGNLPVLKLSLEKGETVSCEAGAMSWMDDCIRMETNTGGGLSKMIGRILTKENAFLNRYTAESPGEVAFSSKFPGSILSVPITSNNGIIIQKGSFLAEVGNVETSVYIQKTISGGFFGGEGFLMRRYRGEGVIFLEIDGSAHEYTLSNEESKIVDTGYLAAMSDTCSLSVQAVRGIKNIFFGGEGIFNTVVTGPGKIYLQSMPISATAMIIYNHMPHPSNNS